MWDHEVENNDLTGLWMWLCPHQGTVLPKYAVMVVCIKIHHHHHHISLWSWATC